MAARAVVWTSGSSATWATLSSYFFQIVIGVTILVSTSITVHQSRRGRRHRTLEEGPAHG